MKTSKKIMSIILMLTLLASLFVGTFTANAAVSTNLIDSSKTATLNIYKYEMSDVSDATVRGNGEQTTNIPESATALEGVTFTVTRVADLLKADGTIDDKYYNTDGTALPTPAEAASMTAIATYTATTNSSGYAVLTNLPLGVYLVQETDSPSQVTGPVDDFVVSLPMTDSTGSAWNYNVFVYPKNETRYSDVTVKKTDYTTGAALKDAVFDLYTSTNNSNWTLVESGLKTGDDGTFKLDSLATSAYYKLKETTAPDGGYILDLDKETVFWIDTDTNVCDPTTKAVINTSNPYLISILNDKPEVSKKVGTSANDVAYTDAVIGTVDTIVYYEVSVTIPEITNMAGYKTLTLTDKLPTELTLNSAPVIKSGTTTYMSGTDYTYTLTANNTITINFVPSELVVSNNEAKVTVTYNCTVNNSVIDSLGAEIINDANLKYSAVVGTGDNEPEDDKPEDEESNDTEVHTSGFEFKKVNESGAALAGTKFKIYATKANAEAGTNALNFMDKNGNVISEAVSGADGLVTFNGLGYGTNGDDVTTGETTYYVVETYAVDGYNLLAEPVAVTVKQNTFTFDTTQMTVENSKKTILPLTGGYGTTIFFTVGIFFILLSTSILIISKKKKTEKGTK